MISPRHPLSSSLVNVAAGDASHRLTLAVARLDDLIARLNHLDQPFGPKEKEQKVSTAVPTGSHPFDQGISLN